MKQQHRDREPARDVPYGGIENLRPETETPAESTSARMKPRSK
jgi:hypothetical protein